LFLALRLRCRFWRHSAANLTKKIVTFYWLQLSVLAGVHFLIDMFASMLPAILPAIRAEFGLSLSLGGLVLVALRMTSNGLQPLIGQLRDRKRAPMLIHLGLILAIFVCLLGIVPRDGNTFTWVILLSGISGIGIAMVHPEGLRAVHRLKRIRPAIGTGVFMTGGFLGSASGGGISAFLVSRYGLKGLYALALCPVIGIIFVLLLRIRLSVESRVQAKNDVRTEDRGLPFWLIMTMALPAAVSTSVLVSLLPTVLNELGFKLTFGGFSATMFGLGGAVGAFLWANLADRKGELRCTILALFLVIPFLIVYLMFLDHAAAIWLLFGAGFFAIAAYILMITMARHAIGFGLGRRMGFVVGGTWAFADIFFIALLPVAEKFGSEVVLKFVPIGYLLSAGIALFILLKIRNRVLIYSAINNL
jgi:FSR family fosmidomycin resistance protein-like MFS transporter